MERIVQIIPSSCSKIQARKKVAAYARVSTGKDAMLHSLSAQVSYYTSYIQMNKEWQYAGVYTDEAITGTKGNRDGFNRMLEQCRAGNINLVLTKSISRFARNTVTLLQTIRELKNMGVDVYFEEEKIHSISSDGEVMLTLLASYAQAESLSASENQKWRVRKGFEKGELMCLRNIYGYTITKSEIIINETTAPIVREIFERAVNGDSFNSIAIDLNDRDIPGAYGGKWTAYRITEILANEKYTGSALLQKQYRNNHLDKKKIYNDGSLPQYFAKDTHDAIIDEETFYIVQEILQKNKDKKAEEAPRETTPFTSKITCGICGAKYRRVTTNGKKNFGCGTYQTKGKAYCSSTRIPADELYRITGEILNNPNFDDDAFNDKITGITATKDNTLIFHLKDGTDVIRQWNKASRSKSWTPQMKEAARLKALERKGKK